LLKPRDEGCGESLIGHEISERLLDV